MKLEDLLGMLVPALFFSMMLVEAIAPARKFPQRKLWRLVGVGCFLVMGVVATVTPLVLPPAWVAAHRLVDLTGLGLAAGAVVGYLGLSLAAYAFHRACHRVHLLWRGVHQMHHSPERVDIAGAAFFHPLDMIAYALLQTAVPLLVLGLDARAAALTGFVATFYAFFQHWNVRTPRWLGFFIQRPESHCVHHEYGVHAWNYSDLPLWDILFGTFRNPAAWEGRSGFDEAARRRVGAMLAFADVNEEMPGLEPQKT